MKKRGREGDGFGFFFKTFSNFKHFKHFSNSFQNFQTILKTFKTSHKHTKTPCKQKDDAQALVASKIIQK
jgi:hypothetical protein